MQTTTRVRKRAAAVLIAAVLAIGASACTFPDVATGEPGDPWNAALFRAINRDRANNGLPALSYSPKLENLAQTWSKQQSDVDTMYHQNLQVVLSGPDYANFCSLGENIAWNNAGWTAEKYESVWYNSAPHRANILNRSFNVVGTGHYKGANGKEYATVDFGQKCR